MNIEVDLEGVIDLHVHTAPDIEPRSMNDLELARAAAEVGMRAVLLKSHYTLTSDRAWLVEQIVRNVRIFGGLTLNETVGGLNPVAVEIALRLGARAIWMPTRSAANHKSFFGEPGKGLSILNEEDKLKPEIWEILKMIAEFEVILATGHLSVKEIMVLISAARSAGVKRILINHPEMPIIALPLEIQRDLARQGIFFERCFVSTLLSWTGITLENIAMAIREVGPESTVLASDLGQRETLTPIQGLKKYISSLLNMGFNRREIDIMTRQNPAFLLGI